MRTPRKRNRQLHVPARQTRNGDPISTGENGRRWVGEIVVLECVSCGGDPTVDGLAFGVTRNGRMALLCRGCAWLPPRPHLSVVPGTTPLAPPEPVLVAIT